MKTIELSGNNGRGKFALVDDEDYEAMSKHRWYLIDGYAQRNKPMVAAVRFNKVRMHREIISAKEGLMVDHINNDKLDNRKANLRTCTVYENARNRPGEKSNPSGLKGVTKLLERDVWVARINISGKTVYLGSFLSKKAAGDAYNQRAKKEWGEFAWLNPV